MIRESAAPLPAESAAPAAGLAARDQRGPQRLVIESRFGTLAVAAENAIDFPKGLVGFEDFRAYALAELSDRRYAQFRVLQSLDDHKLAFLVLPLDPDAGVVDRRDLAAACETLGIAIADLAILLVVTIRRDGDGQAQVSANLRAPLLIDSARRLGWQYVFPNDSYPVRYPI